MRWTIETDEDEPERKQHVLEVAGGEPLGAASVEFWRRLLSAALSTPLRGWSVLKLEIREKQSEGDEVGRLRALFRDARGGVHAETGVYVLRSHRITCIEAGNRDDFLRQLQLYLEHYTELKRAVRAPVLKELFEQVRALGPTVRADTGWGTFDFQLDRDEFGVLPAEDRALLAGRQPRDAALENLTSGLIDSEGLTTFALEDGEDKS